MDNQIYNYYDAYGLHMAGLNDDYSIDINHMVCPCCGKNVKLIDSSQKQFSENYIKVNTEDMLNENKLADYLLEIIESAAQEIYENEILTNVPETDSQGNITDPEYNDRFIYMDQKLKRVIKTRANAIANMVKTNGIDISPFYIENELFQYLKMYGYK